jgi:AraC family transcriptional regulator
MKGNNRSSNVSISRQATLQWPGLKIDYAWLPPHKAVGIAKPNQVEMVIRTVCDFIEEHLCTQITLEDLAALAHLSPFHFARCFKATIGLAPHQYVIARRRELAKRLLLTTTLSVAEIAWSIGYENISHYRRLFTMHSGVTPGAIRRAAAIQQRA